MSVVTVYAIIAPSVTPSPAAKPAATHYDPLTNTSLTNALVACFMVLAFVLAALVSMVYFFRKLESPRLRKLHRQHKHRGQRLDSSKGEDSEHHVDIDAEASAAHDEQALTDGKASGAQISTANGH